MSDEPRIDPLELAERFADERQRLYPTRKQTSGIDSWHPPVFVTSWLCRNPRCGNLVPVTADATGIADRCDEWLRRRNEPTLERTKVVFCDSCVGHFKLASGDTARKRVDTLRSMVVELKQCKNPEGERDLMRKLLDAGHPDVPGLVLAIRTRLDGKPNKTRREL